MDEKLRAAAEAAYGVIDGLLDEFDNSGDDGAIPADWLEAHALLYHALGKAPDPGKEPDWDDVPY